MKQRNFDFKDDTWVPEYAIHTNDKVCGFFGVFRFLSNFWSTPIHYDGLVYPSVENAFQAAKLDPLEKVTIKIKEEVITIDRSTFTRITAREAKKYGGKVPLDKKEWDKGKYKLMSDLVLQKFVSNQDLKEMLLATEDAYLEETNSWNDLYWGKNEDGQGENNLGKILMGVRDTIKNKL